MTQNGPHIAQINLVLHMLGTTLSNKILGWGGVPVLAVVLVGGRVMYKVWRFTQRFVCHWGRAEQTNPYQGSGGSPFKLMPGGRIQGHAFDSKQRRKQRLAPVRVFCAAGVQHVPVMTAQ